MKALKISTKLLIFMLSIRIRKILRMKMTTYSSNINRNPAAKVTLLRNTFARLPLEHLRIVIHMEDESFMKMIESLYIHSFYAEYMNRLSGVRYGY